MSQSFSSSLNGEGGRDDESTNKAKDNDEKISTGANNNDEIADTEEGPTTTMTTTTLSNVHHHGSSNNASNNNNAIPNDVVSVRVAAEVLEIPKRAFLRLEQLKRVQLTQTVEIIQYEAFKFCPALETVEIPTREYEEAAADKEEEETKDTDQEEEDSKQEEDPTKTETKKTNKKSLPKKKKKNKTKQTTQKQNHTDDENDSDHDNDALPEHQPQHSDSNLRRIGEDAFWQCENLVTVGPVIPISITDIGAHSFYKCFRLKNIRFASGIDGTNAKKNDKESPDREDQQQEDTVPVPSCRLERLGYGAFYGCSSLTSLDLSHAIRLTWIAGETFQQCTALRELLLPPRLQRLEACALAYCTSLQELILPETLQVIGQLALLQCTSIQTLHIPAAVTSMGYQCLAQCTNLQVLSFGSTRYLASPSHSSGMMMSGMPQAAHHSLLGNMGMVASALGNNGNGSVITTSLLHQQQWSGCTALHTIAFLPNKNNNYNQKKKETGTTAVSMAARNHNAATSNTASTPALFPPALAPRLLQRLWQSPPVQRKIVKRNAAGVLWVVPPQSSNNTKNPDTTLSQRHFLGRTGLAYEQQKTLGYTFLKSVVVPQLFRTTTTAAARSS